MLARYAPWFCRDPNCTTYSSSVLYLCSFLKMSPRARGLRNFITCSRIRRRGRVDSREQAESERNLWMPGNGTFHISPELLHSALSPIPTIYDPRQARNYVTRGFDVDEGGRRVGSQADDDGNGVDEKDELPAYTRHSIRLPTYAESDNQDLPEQLPLPVTHPTS